MERTETAGESQQDVPGWEASVSSRASHPGPDAGPSSVSAGPWRGMAPQRQATGSPEATLASGLANVAPAPPAAVAPPTVEEPVPARDLA
ncbi:MAG: hypothetical protein ACRDG3_04375, partial [Tepidiformaceae bacterium]